MRLLVIAVGSRLPAWADAAYEDYARRMPRHLPMELVEIRPESRTSGKPALALRAAEGERIAQALPAGAMKVALDERGREFTTEACAKWLERQTGEGRDIAFLIGGADGLDPALKARAQTLIRLSSLTLPHGMVRVLLAEQLYRAWSVTQNHPYHRA